MERFVRVLVAGGLTLLAGLWVVSLVERWAPLWLLGVVLVVVGCCGLGAGIYDELDY
ncbi:hypothetical protein ACFPYI_12585 [Halomarina salina]|uniref:Major facilitator superfamily (MFS) profile domain-containing protein n=1 Tax=Halomarina salina TaxID=1872699 RepID=A0ABD5RPJ5_9EURY|nr:hypothetical protein [Halomarina salina]